MTGLEIYTLSHVVISVLAILAGIPLVYGFLHQKDRSKFSAGFIILSFLTNIGGFAFPFEKFLPSHGVAIIALVILFFGILGKYRYHLQGAWRPAYSLGMTANLYFLFFVLIAQGFSKVPALHVLAPTGSEPAFGAAQAVLLIIFIVLGVKVKKKFAV